MMGGVVGVVCVMRIAHALEHQVGVWNYGGLCR